MKELASYGQSVGQAWEFLLTVWRTMPSCALRQVCPRYGMASRSNASAHLTASQYCPAGASLCI
jgi:hypothetical protein